MDPRFHGDDGLVFREDGGLCFARSIDFWQIYDIVEIERAIVSPDDPGHGHRDLAASEMMRVRLKSGLRG